MYTLGVKEGSVDKLLCTRSAHKMPINEESYISSLELPYDCRIHKSSCIRVWLGDKKFNIMDFYLDLVCMCSVDSIGLPPSYGNSLCINEK